MHSNKYSVNGELLELMAILFFAVIYATIFSSSSFLYSCYYPLDGTIFEIIGKGWTEGKLPYVDLWDQKGPYIYFINAIGYWLTGNKYGLMIVQIIFLWASFVLLFKILKKTFNYKTSVLLFLVLACHLMQLVPSLNVIELYELPFHILAFSYLCKWAKKARAGATNHPPLNALMYGLLFGLCFLNRVTDAVGVCCGCLCVFLYLCKHRLWKNIWLNMVMFILGVAVVILPCFLYFYIKDALGEMLYASILFNFDYANNSYSTPATISSIIRFCLAYFGVMALFLISAITAIIDRVNKFYHLMWTFVSGVTLIYFLKTFRYEHYAIIAIPYFVILIFEFCELTRLLSKSPKTSCCVKYLGVGASIVFVLNGFYLIYQSLEYYINRKEDSLSQHYDSGIVNLLGEDKDELLCYNIHPCIYLHNNITPCCRFFSLQGWYAFFSTTIVEKINASIDKSNAKFVLMKRNDVEKGTLIDDVLQKKYIELPTKMTSDKYMLFKIKE